MNDINSCSVRNTRVCMFHIVKSEDCSKNICRVGPMLKWMDICACLSAERLSHCSQVTLSMDHLIFNAESHEGESIKVTAQVTRAYNSSLEVLVVVTVEDTDVTICSAFFVFCSLKGKGGTRTVLPNTFPETELEQLNYVTANDRKNARINAKELLNDISDNNNTNDNSNDSNNNNTINNSSGSSFFSGEMSTRLTVRANDSMISMTQIVMPAHANHMGNTFGGQIMEWAEECALLAAKKHIKAGEKKKIHSTTAAGSISSSSTLLHSPIPSPLTLFMPLNQSNLSSQSMDVNATRNIGGGTGGSGVGGGIIVRTTAVDSISFLLPSSVGDRIILRAQVHRGFSTWMEVGVVVTAVDVSGLSSRHLNTGYFVVTARDASGELVIIPQVDPVTTQQKQHYSDALSRHILRTNGTLMDESSGNDNNSSSGNKSSGGGGVNADDYTNFHTNIDIDITESISTAVLVSQNDKNSKNSHENGNGNNNINDNNKDNDNENEDNDENSSKNNNSEGELQTTQYSQQLIDELSSRNVWGLLRAGSNYFDENLWETMPAAPFTSSFSSVEKNQNENENNDDKDDKNDNKNNPNNPNNDRKQSNAKNKNAQNIQNIQNIQDRKGEFQVLYSTDGTGITTLKISKVIKSNVDTAFKVVMDVKRRNEWDVSRCTEVKRCLDANNDILWMGVNILVDNDEKEKNGLKLKSSKNTITTTNVNNDTNNSDVTSSGNTTVNATVHSNNGADFALLRSWTRSKGGDKEPPSTAITSSIPTPSYSFSSLSSSSQPSTTSLPISSTSTPLIPTSPTTPTPTTRSSSSLSNSINHNQTNDVCIIANRSIISQDVPILPLYHRRQVLPSGYIITAMHQDNSISNHVNSTKIGQNISIISSSSSNSNTKQKDDNNNHQSISQTTSPITKLTYILQLGGSVTDNYTSEMRGSSNLMRHAFFTLCNVIEDEYTHM